MTLALAALLALGGCASSPTGQGQVTATSTLIPIPPTMTPMELTQHTLAVGGFATSRVIPGPRGLLLMRQFAPTPGGAPASSGQPYFTELAFYDFSTQQVTNVASPPGGIVNATYAGDWITYATGASAPANAVLLAYNLATGERRHITSAGSSMPWQFWVANATDLVWTGLAQASSGATTLYDYTFATGQARTLASSSTAFIKPEAINSSAVLYFEDPETSGVVTGTPSGTAWLQQLNGRAPVKLADAVVVGASMNARYAVWGDPRTGATNLYDLSSGKLSPNMASCLRPALDDGGPYMVCWNPSGSPETLIRLPDGAQVTYITSGGAVGDGVVFYKGRGYYVNAQGQVTYFDLPAQ